MSRLFLDDLLEDVHRLRIGGRHDQGLAIATNLKDELFVWMAFDGCLRGKACWLLGDEPSSSSVALGLAVVTRSPEWRSKPANRTPSVLVRVIVASLCKPSLSCPIVSV